jgi:hypothetical protein
VTYFYLVPYVDDKLLDWRSLETDYPLTFRYLERFRKTFDSKGAELWYAYYSTPVHHPGEVIVSCRIASPHSFARMELSETTIHGSAFGIAINDDKINQRLLLLYLNSGHFWQQLDSTMPPMGTGRKAIRISILKDLTIPRRIVFPNDQHVTAATVLERRIVQEMRKQNPETVDAIFKELDFFIEDMLCSNIGFDIDEMAG